MQSVSVFAEVDSLTVFISFVDSLFMLCIQTYTYLLVKFINMPKDMTLDVFSGF